MNIDHIIDDVFAHERDYGVLVGARPDFNPPGPHDLLDLETDEILPHIDIRAKLKRKKRHATDH